MKANTLLIIFSFIIAVLSDGHTNVTGLADDAAVNPNDVLEEVTEEILAEVQSINSSSTVPVDVVYDVAFDVVKTYSDNEDDNIEEILGHITNAVSELEEIHTGEVGAVSDILVEIMHKAYGSIAPTSAPTVKVTETTMVDDIKNKIVDTTESMTESASNFISAIFNPSPTPGP